MENLENYKIIYEFAKEERKNYNDSRSLGAGFLSEKYQQMRRNEDLARHLFIRKMNEFIREEKRNDPSVIKFTDLGIEFDPETHLLSNN